MTGALDWEKHGEGWPHRECSQFIVAGGLRWHVQICGQGPVLLLLHGTGASSHSWRGLIPVLARRFQVVVPDLPGHGFTATPAAPQLSLPGMAQLVAALLAKLDYQPAIVAAHSAGVAIALRMCLDGTVSPRTVVSINGALMPFGGMASQLFPVMARVVAFNPFVQRFFAGRAEDKRSVTRLIEGTGSRIDAVGLGLYQKLFSAQSHVAATLGMMANWNLEALQKELPKLTQSLVLIVGEADKAVPPEDARTIRKRVRNAHVVSMRGVGHLCHEECPDEVAEIIVEAFDGEATRHAQLSRRSQP
jgi:magnesium chelatase accessory protein